MCTFTHNGEFTISSKKNGGLTRIVLPPCSNARNAFPPQYAQIHEGHQPAELYPDYTAIEYTLPHASFYQPPAFLLVVDLCTTHQELQVRFAFDNLHSQTSQSISPSYILIMSFGTALITSESTCNHRVK